MPFANSTRLLLVTALSCVGCVTSVPNSDECETDSDCEGGSVCAEGVCLEVCNRSIDCENGGECVSGNCQDAVCGNGILAGSEECDVDATGCENCTLVGNTVCNDVGCSEAKYRASLTNQEDGSVEIWNIAIDGTASRMRTFVQGFNSLSRWAEWSADGTQLAYPGGPPTDNEGSVYLYDVEDDTVQPYDFVRGDQPSLAADRLELIARQDDGFATFEPGGTPTVATVGTYSVRWPKWDPAVTDRFAFLSPSTAANDLIVSDTVSDFAVSGDALGFEWAGSGVLYFTEVAGLACQLSSVVLQAASADPAETVIANLPCDGTPLVSPDESNAAVVQGSTVTLFALSGGTVDFSAGTSRVSGGGTVLDVAWTPDNSYLIVLRYQSGQSGPITAELVDVATTAAPVAVEVDASFVAVRFSPEILQ